MKPGFRYLDTTRWTNRTLVGADGDIIAGHARLLAAEKLGMKDVPIILLKHLSPAKRRALIIADNQLAIAGAGWDEEASRAELSHINDIRYPQWLHSTSVPA